MFLSIQIWEQNANTKALPTCIFNGFVGMNFYIEKRGINHKQDQNLDIFNDC